MGASFSLKGVCLWREKSNMAKNVKNKDWPLQLYCRVEFPLYFFVLRGTNKKAAIGRHELRNGLHLGGLPPASYATFTSVPQKS